MIISAGVPWFLCYRWILWGEQIILVEKKEKNSTGIMREKIESFDVFDVTLSYYQ